MLRVSARVRIQHLSSSLAHCVTTRPLTAESPTCLRETRVVTLVWRHIDFRTSITSENIVGSIVLGIEYSRSDECSDPCILVDLLQASSLGVAVVVHIDDVETRAALVPLTGSVDVSFERDSVFLELLFMVHDVESLFLTLKSLFPQIENFRLLLVHDSGSHFLVGFVEVFVKAIALVNKMRRGGIRTENLC